MGRETNLSESIGRQKPGAQSKFRCDIIKIVIEPGFWKAALRITPYFRRDNLPLARGVSFAGTFRRYRELCQVRAQPGRPYLNRKFVASFIDPLIAFVSAHAWLAYLTLFLAALLEAVPIVGSVIPGSTIILALSALVPGGELRLEWVLAAAVAGALIGDGSAFWIGHRSQREILNAWPMANYPSVVAQSEAFFHRWGALAVFFARFVPPIRAFVPLTAGALGMKPLRFYPVNIAAILLWAPAHVLPGVLAVSVLDHYGGWLGIRGTAKHYWMPLVIIGALIVWLAIWAIRRHHGGGVIEPATAAARKDP
jgi:membrane protein DedA with SNARE-associated domain